MRVQIGTLVFDMNVVTAIYIDDDGDFVVEADRQAFAVDPDVKDAAEHWLNSGCPLPVAGELIFDGHRYAFNVADWYLEQQGKGAF